MSELDSGQQKHLDFLIADFNATKAEITRRSNLQRVVLAAYVVLLGLVFKQVASNNLSLFWLCGLWVGGALAQSFHQRERLEIRRLGRLIEERIAKVASTILKINPKDFIHSQTNNKFPEVSKKTRPFDRLFHWTLFCLIPILFSIYHFMKNIPYLRNLIEFTRSTPWVSFIMLLALPFTRKK